MKKTPKNKAAQALGALGGKATAKKYSSKQLAEWGRTGGRGNKKKASSKKGRAK